MVFLLVFFFWDPYDSNVVVFTIVLEVSEIVFISVNLFFFYPLGFFYFYHSIFKFANAIFCLCYSTICCLQSFLISFIAFSLYIDSFISSRSLLNISCIFSILVSSLFICNSLFFSKSLDNLYYHYSFSGRPPISSSFVWFGWHLSCSFTS